jgi:putative flippase GtrA
MLDLVLFGVLLKIFDSVLLANVASATICVLLNYLAHNYWTFPNQVSMKKSTSRFGLQAAASWSLETALLIGAHNIGLNMLLAKFCTTAFFAAMSLAILNAWVFKSKSIG